MDSRENLLGVLETLFRWKKQIITVLVVTIIGSVVLSLLMDNYYKASTLFYAASQDLAKPPTLGPALYAPNYYGEGEDVDRIMTIANSGELLDYLVYRFDLYDHYDIDTNKVIAPFLVKEALLSQYSVMTTKHDAIDLSVEDIDPELAASMANAAREKIEEIGRNLIKKNLEKQKSKYENMIATKEEQLVTLNNQLTKFRDSFGIYYLGMGEGLSELSTQLETNLSGLEASRKSYYESRLSPKVKKDTLANIDAKIAGLKEKKAKLANRLSLFSEGIGQIGTLERQHAEARTQLGIDKETLKQIETVYNDETFPILILVEEAKVPVIKSRPKRSLLVLGALCAAFIFSILGILLIEQYKDVNWNKVING